MRKYQRKDHEVKAITFDDLLEASEQLTDPYNFHFEIYPVKRVEINIFVIEIDSMSYTVGKNYVLFMRFIAGVKVEMNTMERESFDRLYEPVETINKNEMPFTERTTREILEYNMFKNYGITEREFFTRALSKHLEKQFLEFDENGLKFTAEHLDSIGLSVISLPIFIMTNYVDQWTKHYIDTKDQDFIGGCINQLNGVIYFKDAPATAIGNIAYIYKNCNNEMLKGLAKKALLQILDYYIQHCLTEI